MAAFFLAVVFGQGARGATTLFSDGFENGVNGWQFSDLNPAGPPTYWGVVDSAFGGEGTHGGTHKLYCAATNYTGTPAIPFYTGGMAATASRSLDLSGYTNATLSFWYKIPSLESSYDFVKVFIDDTELWSRDTAQAQWTQVQLSLDTFVGGSHTVRFQFFSDFSANEEGCYLEDILVTDASIPGPPRTNDNFNAAQVLLGVKGSLSGSNRQATAEPGEPASGFAVTNSVWFRWTTISNGPVTFSTAGSAFDTVLCAYSGMNLDSLTLVAFDGNGNPENRSRVTFEAVTGVPYYLSLRGAGNQAGLIQLSWNQPNVIPTELLPDLVLWADPAQNFLYGWYLDRAQIPGRTLLRVSSATPNIGTGPLELIGSSTSPEVSQRIYRNDGSFHDQLAGTFTFHPDHGHLHFNHWLHFYLRSVLPDDGVGAIVVAGDKTSFALLDIQNYDPSLPGHPAAPRYRGGLIQGLSVGWADVYAATLPDQWIDVTGIAPGRYWLEAMVDPGNQILELNESNNLARILINLTPGGLTGAPGNDDFTNAVMITGVVVGWVGSNAQATKETGLSEPNHAGNTGGASVWYRWIAPSNMTVTISTEGSDFDTLLAVYGGDAVGALTRVSSNDNASLKTTSLLSFNATAGTLYSIAVDGYGGVTGQIQLHFNPAWNDHFQDAIVLAGPAGTIAASSLGATRQPGEPLHAGVPGTHSTWYSWTAPVTGLVVFDTTVNGFDGLLAVYTGSELGTLTPVVGDDNSGHRNPSRLTFSAISNATYRIAVDAPGEASGLVRLAWQGATPPMITGQPQATNLAQGSTLQLAVEAGGWAPLSYQWRHAGTNMTDGGWISGAASARLTIQKVLPSDAGTYTVIVTNLYGMVTSAPANLIVLDNPRAIYLEDLRGAIGGTVVVPVQMLAAGDEHALNFSLMFDPAVLSRPRVVQGANAAGAVLSVNTNRVPEGSLGVSMVFPIGQAIPGGQGRELARVLFDVAPGTGDGVITYVGFGDVPLARYVAATNGATLHPVFAAGLLMLEHRTTVVTALRLAEGQVQLLLNGVPGRDYLFESSDAVDSTQWMPLATNRTDLAGLLQFSETSAGSTRQRFFRARLLPPWIE